MCGSVQTQRQQPVYTPPASCAPAPQQAPKACTPPPCDSFTPPPVVSPEKPVAAAVASPERPTTQSTSCADAPTAQAQAKTCDPERNGLMKMLGAIFTAVLAFAAIFSRPRADDVNADGNRDVRNNDREGCASRDWRNFEGRARQHCVVAQERDARAQTQTQVFTPPTCTQRV